MRRLILTLVMLMAPPLAYAASIEVTTPGNNIGIGSVSPGAALDVQGTLRVLGSLPATGTFKNYTTTSGAIPNGAVVGAQGGQVLITSGGNATSHGIGNWGFCQDNAAYPGFCIGTEGKTTMTSTQAGVTSYGLVSYPSYQSDSAMGAGSAIEGLYILPQILNADGVTPNTNGIAYGIYIDEPVGGAAFRGLSGLKSNTGTTLTSYIDLQNKTTGSVQLTPQITLEGDGFLSAVDYPIAWSLGGSNVDSFGAAFALTNTSSALGTNNFNVWNCEYNGSCGFAGNVGINGASQTAAALNVTGAALISGNIGVGSTNPGQVVDVNGNVRAASFIGTGVGVSSTNGNLGVGSTNPGQVLDVAGTARMTGFIDTTSPTNGYVMTSDANGKGTWAVAAAGSPGGSSGQLQWNSSSSFAGVSGSGVDSNGNVGVGSATPGQKLDVAGTVRMTGFNIASGAGNGKILTSDSSGNGTWGSAGAGTNYWILGTGGNLGIGTANTVGIGTTLGNGSLEIMPSATGSGNVGIGTWNPQNQFCVGGTCQTFIDSTGNVGIQTQIKSLGGDATFILAKNQLILDSSGSSVNIQNISGTANSGIQLQGSHSATSGAFIDLVTSAGNSTNGYVRVRGGNAAATEIARFTDSGNVGIGTANPTGFEIETLNVGIGTSSAGIAAGTKLLVFGGNVGIGTVSPGVALDVKGDIRDNDFSGQASGTLMCVKTGGAMGYCTGTVVGVGCTCN